jgi:hypothetical protein
MGRKLGFHPRSTSKWTIDDEPAAERDDPV